MIDLERKKRKKAQKNDPVDSSYESDSFCTGSGSSDESGEEEEGVPKLEEEFFHHKNEEEYHQKNPSFWQLDCGRDGVVHLLKRDFGV